MGVVDRVVVFGMWVSVCEVLPASAGIAGSHRHARSRPLTLCEGGGAPASCLSTLGFQLSRE